MFTLTVLELLDATSTDDEPFESLSDDTAVSVLPDRSVRTVADDVICVMEPHEYVGAVTYRQKRDLLSACEAKGILVSDDYEWCDTYWLLWFGAYGTTRVLAWGSLDDALEAAAGIIADKAPGIFATDQVNETYNEAIAKYSAVYALTGAFQLEPCSLTPDCDLVAEWAHDEATTDMTYTESGYIPSWEWGYVRENPTVEDILSL